jgi:hypothetical protein
VTHLKASQRTRDQRLSRPNRFLDVRSKTWMFFGVSSLTYHSAITIAGGTLSPSTGSSRRAPAGPVMAIRFADTSALITTNPLPSSGPWLCDNEAGSETS